MADGALTLTLDDYTAAKIAERARALGVPPEELAAMVLDARFFDYDDFTWINGDPRQASDDIDEEGARDWSQIRPEMEAYLESRLKARR